jgi:homoserine/homoserine lactone efflux protein
MSTDQYWLYVAVTSIFMLSPGPSVVLVISNSVKFGTKKAMTGAFGNVLAFQVLVILSALGLGVILTASSHLFYILKMIGAAYLVYLGLKLWFSSTVNYSRGMDSSAHTISRASLFKQAFFVTSSNPKALIYVSALLPQFINPEQSLFTQVLILGLTAAVLQLLTFLIYALIAGQSKQFFQNEQNQLTFNRISGITFIGFGTALGLSESNS